MLTIVSKVDAIIALKSSLLKLQMFKVGEGLNSIFLIHTILTKMICSSQSCSKRFIRGVLQFFSLRICKFIIYSKITQRYLHFLQFSKALIVGQFLHETTSNANTYMSL